VTLRTIWTLLAAILTAAALILISRESRSPNRGTSGSARLVLPVDERDIRIVKIERPGAKFTFEKKGTVWNVSQPVQAPTDSARILRILERVAGLKWSTVVSPAQVADGELKGISPGFGNPIARIMLVGSDGRTNTLTIGNPAGSPGQSYMQSSIRNGIMIASDAVLALLPESLTDLRDHKLIHFAPESVTRIECTGIPDTLQLSRARDGQWRLHRPVAGRASDLLVRSWLDAFYKFRITSFVADSTAAASLYGIDNPVMQITFSKEGEAPRTIKIGRETVTGGRSRYAAIAGQEQIFTIGPEVLDWAATRVDGLRDRTVLPYPSDSVTGIHIRGSEESLRLSKTSGTWIVTAPASFNAHGPAVKSMLDAFADARILSFRDQDPIPVDSNVASRGVNSISFMWGDGSGPIDEWTIQLHGKTSEDVLICSTGADTDFIELPATIAGHFNPQTIRFRDPVVFELDRINVERVTQQLADRTISLIRSNELFYVELPGLIPDMRALDQIFDACAGLKAEQLIADNVYDLTLYGFVPESPQLVFGVPSEGVNRVLLLGRPTLSGDVYAMRQGHDVIFTISAELAGILTTPIAQPAASASPIPNPVTSP